VPVEPGVIAPGLDEDAGDDVDVDGDELAVADDVVAVCDDVVPAVAEPPVDASATPVTPAPSPAATAPVMISRRTRPPDMETIGLPPFPTAAADRGQRRQARACAARLPRTRNGPLSTL